MSDAEGDSTMHSSPEPATPTKTSPAFPLDPSNELSPPHSQGVPIATTTASEINANGKRVLSSAGGPAATSSSNITHTDPSTGYTWSRQEDQPGWEWKNPRAREDMERALESIVDKGSQIKNKYGDPLKPHP